MKTCLMLPAGSFVVAVFLWGCGSERPSDPAPSPAPSESSPVTSTNAAPTPTVTPYAEPPLIHQGMHPRGTRTGNSMVDRVLDLYEQQNAGGLVSLVRFQDLPCVATLDPIRPQCPPGVPLGTVVPGTRIESCEGGMRSSERIQAMFERELRDPGLLYGVYRDPDRDEVIVLIGRGPEDKAPLRLPLDTDGRIPRVEVGCGGYNVPLEGVTWVLPPAA